jgi:HSP20 family protein
MAKKPGKVAVKTAAKAPAKASAEAPGAKRSEWHPLSDLRREVDHLFDEFTSSLPFGRRKFDPESFRLFPRFHDAAVPAVDVVEEDRRFEITAELPGLTEKDIEVSMSDHSLTIKGEKKQEKEEKKKDFYLSERYYGAFRRSFSLPEGVDSRKIDATFKDGILRISLPKTAASQKKERKIAITAK